MAHYVTDNSDKAIADFSSLIEIDPDHKDAYAFRGIVYEFERKLNLAKRDFQKAYDLGLRSPLIQDYVQKYDLRK